MRIALVTLVTLTREVLIGTDNAQTLSPHLTQMTLKRSKNICPCILKMGGPIVSITSVTSGSVFLVSIGFR